MAIHIGCCVWVAFGFELFCQSVRFLDSEPPAILNQITSYREAVKLLAMRIERVTVGSVTDRQNQNHNLYQAECIP